jgi:tetratricopeptide (TPR) repeat protein
MFFTRLRRRAKWVFLALALAFAFGFVAFGVGAGGSGIGDYFADLFRGNSDSSGNPSVEEARAKVAESPNDLTARRELANALQASGQLAAAIPHLERFTEGRPKDADALAQLASLYAARAERQGQAVRAAQADSSGSAFAQEITGSTSPLAESFSGPITNLEREEISARVNELYLALQTTYAKQADAWQRLTELQPREASHYLQLGQAQFLAGSTTAAIAAWKKFLELAPDDPNAPLIRQQIRALEQSAQGGN